jgi:hypothetical protein
MSFQVREVVHGLEVVLSVSEFCCDERGLGVPPAELRLAMEIAMPLQVLERSRGDRAAWRGGGVGEAHASMVAGKQWRVTTLLASVL